MSRQKDSSQTDRYLEQFIRPGLNLTHLQDIKAAFDAFDPAQTGRVAPKDIKTALQQEGPEAVSHPLYQLVCDLDQEGGGPVDFERFLSFLTPSVSGRQSREEMREIFQLFDDEKTGRISLAGLRRLTSQWHLEWAEQDLQQMLRQGDSDGDGFISFQDFYGILSYRPSLD